MGKECRTNIQLFSTQDRPDADYLFEEFLHMVEKA